jgi:hypothetical protein
VEPWQRTLDEFLGLHFVGEAFAIAGRAEEDYGPIWALASDPDSLGPPLPVGAPDGYEVRLVLNCDPYPTVVLIGPAGEPVGFDADGQVWIDEGHRGKGLSAFLILGVASLNGGYACRDGDGTSYSPAGHAAHVAAHRLAVETALQRGLPVPPEVLASHGLRPPGGQDRAIRR